MIEIKTITENTAFAFDKAVNAALMEGWDLVRRECFITGSDRATTFYAELERFVYEAEDEDEGGSPTTARWEVTRAPATLIGAALADTLRMHNGLCAPVASS